MKIIKVVIFKRDKTLNFKRNYMHKLATARTKKFGRLNDGQEHFVVSEYFQKLSDGTVFYKGEDHLGNHYFATNTDLSKVEKLPPRKLA